MLSVTFTMIVQCSKLERLPTTSDVSVQPDETARPSLGELDSEAEASGRSIKDFSISAALAARGRVEVMNWRKHGDDESYCRVEVFGADDNTDTGTLIEKENAVRVGAEDEGDYAATYYVNDHITIADGSIMTSHDGRRFRIGVVLAD
jgi:hypothetical protein